LLNPQIYQSRKQYDCGNLEQNSKQVNKSKGTFLIATVERRLPKSNDTLTKSNESNQKVTITILRKCL